MAPVPDQFIDAEGDGPAFGRTGEIVLVDLLGFLTPCLAVVPEVPDQLLLLGVDADDGPPCGGEGFPLRCDIPELLVPLRAVRSTLPLFPLVGLERVAHLPEQAPHRARARRVPLILQPLAQSYRTAA